MCLAWARTGQTTSGAPVRLVTHYSVYLHWPLTASQASSTLHTIVMDIYSKLSFVSCVSTALCVCLVLRLNGHVKTVFTPECSSTACSGERFTGWHTSPPICLSLTHVSACICSYSLALSLQAWFRHVQSFLCCSTQCFHVHFCHLWMIGGLPF